MKSNYNDVKNDRKAYVLPASDYLLYLSVVVLYCGGKHRESVQRVTTDIHTVKRTHTS